MMRYPVGQRTPMDAFNAEHLRNTQFVSNAPGTVERNRIGQYGPVGTFNADLLSLRTPWNSTESANNVDRQADIINGRDNYTGTSYPGNANRGPSWSEVCHPPRVRFVDRIGADQFIQ